MPRGVAVVRAGAVGRRERGGREPDGGPARPNWTSCGAKRSTSVCRRRAPQQRSPAGRWEHRRPRCTALREGQAQLQAQIEEKQQRIAALDEEQAALAEQIAGQASEEKVVQGWLASLAEKIEPAEAEESRWRRSASRWRRGDYPARPPASG